MVLGGVGRGPDVVSRLLGGRISPSSSEEVYMGDLRRDLAAPFVFELVELL